LSSDDGGADRRAKGIVFELIEELIGARNKFRDEEFANNGSASEDAYKRFCARIVQTADYLDAFEDESAIDDEEFTEFVDAVEQIKALRGEVVTVEVPAPGDTSAMQSAGKEVPAILNLNAEWLIWVSKQAEAITNDLGWGPSVKAETPHDEVSHDDLRGLVEIRGQQEALDSLPNGGD
jgi:hypothetical protein